MDLRDYTLSMTQQDFRRILEKYLDDACTPEENELVEKWFDAINSGEARALSEDNERLLWESYDKGFRERYANGRMNVSPPRTYRNVWVRIAAAVLILLIPLLYIYIAHIRTPGRDAAVSVLPDDVTRFENRHESGLLVSLRDGSDVVLNPGSNLSYASSFGKISREVLLEGEAFFKVAHNPSMPFVVKARDLTARVLGTSFTVKANSQDENIIVTVKSGRVSVEEVVKAVGSDKKPEVLTSNQQAIYNVRSRVLSRSRLDSPATKPDPESPKTTRFKEAPVSDILKAIERIYGTRILFDEQALGKRLLSTIILKDENIFRRLDIICLAIGATYTVEDVSIRISCQSCDQIPNLQKKSTMDP